MIKQMNQFLIAFRDFADASSTIKHNAELLAGAMKSEKVTKDQEVGGVLIYSHAK